MIDRDNVISNVRACLLSTKGGIAVRAIDRDYRTLIGHNIPFRELGYPNLEQFLRSIPNMHIFSGPNGELMFDAIPSKDSAHLAALIAKQKSAPKKAKLQLRNDGQRRPASSWKQMLSNRQFPRKPELRQNIARRPYNDAFENRKEPFYSSQPLPVMSVPAGYSPNTLSSYEKPPRFTRQTIVSPPQQSANARLLQTQRNQQQQVPLNNQLMQNISPVKSENAHLQNNSTIPSLLDVRIGEFQTDVLSAPQSPRVTFQQQQSFKPKKESRDIYQSHPPSPPVIQIKETVRRSKRKVVPPVIDIGFTPPTGSVTDMLSEYAVSLGLGKPNYKMIPLRHKRQPVVYTCHVKVGQYSFSSTSEEKTNPEDAALCVAQIALEELKKMYKGLASQSGDLPVTKDESVLMSRFSEIVANHQNGLFLTQVPVDYMNQYNESLPDNWEEIISDCPTISMEAVAGNRTILWPCQEEIDKQGEDIIQSFIKETVPPPLNLPEDKNLDVYVTSAVSTAEVWIRLIGDNYSVLFEKMAQDMEDFYNKNKNNAVKLKEGSFYAVEADDCWHRVQLLELNENEACVYYIDHGDEDTIPADKLCVLDKRFAELPWQAVGCSLADLEDFASDSYAVNLLERCVIGKTFVGEVIASATEEEPMSVILFDTSTEEDINMNQYLADEIRRYRFTPKLPQEDMVADVFVSHISDSGDVYVQIQSEAFDFLQSQIKTIVDASLNKHLPKASDITRNSQNLYLAEFNLDGCLYRAKIVEENPETQMAEVVFVDYGNTEHTKLSELILLDNLDDQLKDVPPQAIRVNMHNLPPPRFNERIASRLRELVPVDDPVLLKVVVSGNPPEVELFKRITEERLLVSINNTLALDPDLLRPAEKSSGTETSRKKRIPSIGRVVAQEPNNEICNTLKDFKIDGVSSSGDANIRQDPIPPPVIPEVNNTYDVHVTLASNPGNFVVQSYENLTFLDTLMHKMQEAYGNSPPSTSNIVEGNYYAALHSDGLWYRCRVLHLLPNSITSVYFCDYGDMSMVSCEKLRPLSREFMVLPYQAIKARLSGVRPIHGDWSVDDCMEFQKLVVEKFFVSLVLDVSPNTVNTEEIVLGLKLIDTSTEKDIYIDQILVDQNRAVFVNGKTV